MLRHLLPTVCLSCGRWVPVHHVFAALCSHCTDALPWNDLACERCALPLLHHPRRCPARGVTRAIAALRYLAAPARWVVAAKRYGGQCEARLLGELLTAVVRDAYADAPLPDLLVPVPLAWPRLLRRGHNQARRIALPMSRALGLPLTDRLVQRRRHTAMQPGLNAAARRRNLTGAFATAVRWDGCRVAIVDDVMTSGATVDSLTRTLLDAGAKEVHVWCATRALGS